MSTLLINNNQDLILDIVTQLLVTVQHSLLKMEQVNLGYSMKNIPMPSRNTYLQMFINSIEKTSRNLSWKAHFFLNPPTKTSSKENYGFKSIAPAPFVKELKQFEDGLISLVKDIQFEDRHNKFQRKLNLDIKEIKNETRVFVAGDKSTNFHKMAPQKYSEMLDKAIHKEYKKAPPNIVKNIKKSHKQIVTELELENRVFQTTARQPFVTVKDHKANYQNNPTCRLINPSKAEIGKISQKITRKINSIVREKTGFKQWQNTGAVINWFKNIENKKNKKFIVFDVVNFYPSISAELMEAAIEWARNFIQISDSDKKIIMEAKKSLIFKNGEPWMKKGGSIFDVAQGSYDGAEACELVGLYILSMLENLKINVGIYRDDGLAVTNSSPRQVDILKKKIQTIFNNLGLEVTIEANQKIVNFLDITMNLEEENFKPFTKPNTTPLYIDSQSNHPPSIIKNLPASINKRLSSISSSKVEFDNAAPLYQEALTKSGYKHKLEFDPCASNANTRSRNRKRNITWFNPPFSHNVKTNVGEKFLKLVDRCFPKNHPLRPICNRNTLKLSYRCTPNMGSIISAKNKKLLQPPPKQNEKTCNCKGDKICPVDRKCLSESVVYRATVTEESGVVNTYTGLTCNDFKTRWNAHNHSFNNSNANQTTLSTYIHDLKNKQIEYNLKWDLVSSAKPFDPVTGICALCTREKFFIAFNPTWATLNLRTEMFSSCRHKIRKLLCEDKT